MRRWSRIPRVHCLPGVCFLAIFQIHFFAFRQCRETLSTLPILTILLLAGFCNYDCPSSLVARRFFFCTRCCLLAALIKICTNFCFRQQIAGLLATVLDRGVPRGFEGWGWWGVSGVRDNPRRLARTNLFSGQKGCQAWICGGLKQSAQISIVCRHCLA